MKAVLLLFIFLGSTGFIVSYFPLAPVWIRAKPCSSLPVDTINYTMQIQPLLEKKCMPCHFAGGKMYQRMPFDRSETILGFEAGVLKRISDGKENALIRQFFEQEKLKRNLH